MRPLDGAALNNAAHNDIEALWLLRLRGAAVQNDVTFGEDDSKIKKGFAPENMNSLRKMALQRVSKIEDKLSKKKRRYKASLNVEYLEKIVNL